MSIRQGRKEQVKNMAIECEASENHTHEEPRTGLKVTRVIQTWRISVYPSEGFRSPAVYIYTRCLAWAPWLTSAPHMFSSLRDRWDDNKWKLSCIMVWNT